MNKKTKKIVRIRVKQKPVVHGRKIKGIVDEFNPQRLVLARLLFGVTGSDLAAAVGVSRSTLGGWENSHYGPDARELERFEKFFKVSPGFFCRATVSLEDIDQLLD